MKTVARRMLDWLATLSIVVVVAVACGILFVRLWSINDSNRPTASTLSGVGRFLEGVLVGLAIVFVGRVLLKRHLARRHARKLASND